MRTPTHERLSADSDGPRLPASAGSARRCILSGERAPRAGLLRLAIAPDGLVLPDPAAKAPGRGAWIGVTRAQLAAALADGRLRRALARAFKGAPLTLPDDLPERAEAALVRHLCARLGLELRAGHLVLGAARIADEARAGRIAALYHASDSRLDGRRKLDQAWRVGIGAEGTGLCGMVLPLDRAALSVALGRDNVVHLGVAGHAGDMRAASRVGEAVSRLVQFTGDQRASAAIETGRDAPGCADRPQDRAAAQDEYVKD